MLLVNGARGIGTGYSTFVPSFNPKDLKDMIVEWLKTGTGLEKELTPWVRGFKGTISKLEKNDYLVEGVWKVEKDTAVITELPVGTWTADFRETLDKLVADGTFKDYTDTSTDTDVNIKIKFGSGGAPAIEKLVTDKIKLTNMHAFNAAGAIHKYDSPNDILREYVGVRLDLYEKRREHALRECNSRVPYHENVVRFIRQQCEPTPRPDLRRKTPEECDSMLKSEGFLPIKDSYDYLLDLPIKSLTLKNATKHENDLVELKQKIEYLTRLTPKQMWLDDLENV
jgi:DNA topoisomerase-2